ncbi:VOC family protein [Plantactinospora sp. S1510]|uniref:VOC family protein n=1 Tax=Plantactinospora alkalitolerans TaxID=2789879 RepID=A0ABS0GQM2_9ACTN|nr:VOC family protein [Plantactinospora alkalitolerans]MBF9128488.1 VOC family protein [Plantactinospora alkalitolerans]
MSVTASQKVTTFLMFEGSAEEAMTFYTSLFDDAEVLAVDRYGPDESGTEGSVRHATFAIAGQQFMCIDSNVQHQFGFTPAISLWVQCETEEEIDRLYAALVEKGAPLMPLGSYGFSAKFGWVNDRFGVSWQLTLPAEAPPAP